MATIRRSMIVSILFAVFGGPGFVLVYLPYWITRFRTPAGEPWWQMSLAAALMLAGIVPLLESVGRFIFAGRGTLMPTVPTEHLVVSGFYRHVRNPMYVGVMLALAGEAILFETRAMVVYVAIIALVIHLFICFYEEHTLTRRYGGEYLLYKRSVPRWLPRLTPWNGEAE